MKRVDLRYSILSYLPPLYHVAFPAYRGLSVPTWFVNKSTTECFSYEKVFMLNAKNHSEKKPPPADTVTLPCCY